MSFSTQHDTQKNAIVQSKEQEQEVVDVQKQEGQSHPKSDVDVSRKIINGSRVQPKLTMGSVGDKYEQEADETADKVMSKPMDNSFSGGADDESPNISKKAFLQAAEEETDTVNPKAVALESEEQISKKSFLQAISQEEQISQMSEEPEVAAMTDDQVSKMAEEPEVAAKEEEQISKKSFLQTVSQDEQVSKKSDESEVAAMMDENQVSKMSEEPEVSKMSDEQISKKAFLQRAEEDSETINSKTEDLGAEEQISKKDFLQTVLYEENKDVKNDMVNAKEEEALQSKEEDPVQMLEEEETVQSKEEEADVSLMSEDQVSAKVEFPNIPGTNEIVKPDKDTAGSAPKPEKGEQKEGEEKKPAEGEAKKEEGTKKGVIDVVKPKKPRKSKLKPPKLQKKANSVNNTNELDASFETSLKSTKGGGRPMPKKVREEMEQRFGRSFKNIRIHTGGEAAQLCKEIGAKAFTNGNHIYFNQGQFNPESLSGKLLLAHELTHTIQQGASGREKVQREPFELDGDPPTTVAAPPKTDDGSKVNDQGDGFMKDHDNFDEDNVDKPVSEMDDDEKESMNATSGESGEELEEVEDSGVNKPEVDKGKVAVDTTKEQQKEIETKNSEAETEEAAPETEEEKGEEKKSDAELAAQRSEVALKRAEKLKDPTKFPEFKEPRIEKPKDKDGKELPGDPEVDHMVLGLAYLGKSFREHAFELLRHSIAQKKKSYSIDAVLEKQREDLANAYTVSEQAEESSNVQKEVSEGAKAASKESAKKQKITAEIEPGLSEIANSSIGDAEEIADDAGGQASDHKSNMPKDADARKDAEEQGSDMESLAEGVMIILEALMFASLSLDSYRQDAINAEQNNAEGDVEVAQTDAQIIMLDEQKATIDAGNAQTEEELANVEFGPQEMRDRAASVEDGGYELYAATVVMELELIDIQENYLNQMAEVKSVRMIEEENATKEKQKKGKGESGDMNFTEDQLSVLSMADMSEEEQEKYVEGLPEGKEEDLNAALEGLSDVIGSEDEKEAYVQEEQSLANELLGRKRKRLDLGWNKAMGMDQQDPREAEYVPIENERKERLQKPLDIADKNMTLLSYQEKETIAANLVTDSIVYDVGNMFTWENAGKMVTSAIDPRMVFSGVGGGVEKLSNGWLNFEENWKEDPVMAVLQAGADTASGIAQIASSILGVSIFVNAVLLAITIFGWMFPSVITVPSMTWFGTIMTVTGYVAMVAGALAARLNQLLYQRNLHKAAAAPTAREFLGFSLEMKKNSMDEYMGYASIAAGYGGMKMGPGFTGKNIVSKFGSPKRALATLRQGARGLKNLPKNLINRAASGITKLASGGKSALKWLKERIKKLFSKKRNKTGDSDLDLGTQKKPPKNGDLGSLDGKKVKSETDFADGHKAKRLEDGQCAICSNCKTIRGKFKGDLDGPTDAKLKKLENELKDLPEGSDAAKKNIAEQKQIHDDLVRKQTDRLEPEVKAMQDRIDSGDRSMTKQEMDDFHRNKRLLEQNKNHLEKLRIQSMKRPHSFNNHTFDVDSAPMEIPPSASVTNQIKTGYTQVKFKWQRGKYKYEARWHTRTPGAPATQGDTWVITRTRPGNSQGLQKIQHILTGPYKWTPMNKWQQAVSANQAGIATLGQQNMLSSGHHLAY